MGAAASAFLAAALVAAVAGFVWRAVRPPPTATAGGPAPPAAGAGPRRRAARRPAARGEPKAGKEQEDDGPPTEAPPPPPARVVEAAKPKRSPAGRGPAATAMHGERPAGEAATVPADAEAEEGFTPVRRKAAPQKEPKKPPQPLRACPAPKASPPQPRKDVDPQTLLNEDFVRKAEALRETQRRCPTAEVEFRILINGKYYSLHSLFEGGKFTRAGLLVDVLLATTGTIRGGLFVAVEGKPFSNEKTVEELWMAVTWFTAVSKLAAGDRQAAAYPCWVSAEQEAKVTLTLLDGEALELAYEVPLKLVTVPTVRVAYRPFVEAALREAKLLLKFTAGLAAALAQKARACDAAQRDRLRGIEDCLPKNVGAAVSRIEDHWGPPP